MVLRTGYQTFEFQKSRELRFGSTEDAASWLRHLGYPDPDLVARLRELVALNSDDAANSRLTDDQVLQHVATLLRNRRITVVARDHQSNSGQAAATAPAAAPAFPLSERAPRTSTASTAPPPASDPPTFSTDSSAAAQAAALVAAAAAGTPFCQECSKH